MNRPSRPLSAALAVLVIAGACSSNNESADEPIPTSSTIVEDEVESTTTAEAPTESAEPTTTTAAPTTTVAPATTVAPTTTAPTTTTAAADDEAPAAPSGLVCSPGGGSGEVTLSWDAPADPADIATVQIYLREAGGSFSRIHTYTPDRLLTADGATWRANVFPVPFGEPIDLAVTYDDAAENESGWNPIDAWSPFAGGPCEQGAPATPVIDGAFRGAGSLEVTLDVSGVATDVNDWSAQLDQGAGFVSVGVVSVEDRGAGDFFVTIAPTDWTLGATYRLVAIDAHGFSSGTAERICPTPISPGDVAC